MKSALNEKLLSASADGDIEGILTAVKEGADINGPDASSPYKYTPLIMASRSGYAEAVKALIISKADLNLTDSKGYTALMNAAWFGKLDTVRVLIDSGARLDAVNADGNTALMEACVMGHYEAVSMLLKAGADISRINRTGHSAYDLAKTKEIRSAINKKMNLLNHIWFAIARMIRKGS